MAFTGNYWYLLVITGNVVVVDSNCTRQRGDRLQLSVLLDASLVVSLRSAARSRGMTIAGLVERALEVELDGYVDVGAGGAAGAGVEGVGVRQVGGRDSVDGPVSPDVGRRVAPDWDAILTVNARGPRVLVPDRDPIEDIA